MLEQVPGALAVALLIAATPAALRLWWGRALAPLADDPLLPERLAAHARRVGASGGTAAAVLVLGFPSMAPWGVPLLILAQIAAAYPLRRVLYQETWSFASYVSFYARMTAAFFGFWILLAATPWIASLAGRYDWAAGLTLAGLLLLLNHHAIDVIRRLVRAHPMADRALLDRFEALVARCGVAPPHFEYIAMRGGVLANAVALASLRRCSVIFTDTLLSRLSADEATAICAHELAHLEYYNRARLRRMNVASYALIAIAASIAPMHRLLFDRPGGATGSAVFLVAMFVVLFARAKHRQKNETASDLRAVELTGDADALARALTTLHTIGRVPRRWDKELERHATHPSLARRIRDIRAAAGISAAPIGEPRAFQAANGVAAVTFEDERIGWAEKPGTLHLLDYGTLAELRLHATAGGAVTLVAAERGGRRWQMSPRAEDVPRLNALLDAVDGKLTHEAPANMPFSAAVSRLIAMLAMGLGWLVGQFAFGLVALLAAIVPAAALLNGAAAAAFTAAAVLVRDGIDEATLFQAGLVFALGAGLLATGRARRSETSRAATVIASVLGVAAALAVVSIGLGGVHPIRLHQGARAVPAAAILLTAFAAACFTWRERRLPRYAAGVAAAAGVAVAALGSTFFLDRATSDPFLIAAAPVRWTTIAAPAVAEFEVPFDVERLRLSPRGRLAAIRPAEPDYQERPSSVIHVGRPGEPLARMVAADIAFLDDRRAVRLVIEDQGAEVQSVVFDAEPVVMWRQPIDHVRWGSIAVDARSNRWTVTGRGEEGRLIHASGIVGSTGVQAKTWDGRTVEGGWAAAFAARGADAVIVEHDYSYGPLSESRAVMLAILLARPNNVTRFWRLRDGERTGMQESMLDSRCLGEALDDGRIVCTAFDGTRTRIVAIDPSTAAVTALAVMDGRFVSTGDNAGGWIVGWAGSTPTAVRLATREAVRAPAQPYESVHALGATDAAIATVMSTDAGSRIRIYALEPAPAGASARVR